jgi:hypothetical protein
VVLPPILELYVVWHPADRAGGEAAAQFFDHFHGTIFSGLIGGAIEVYIRSAGWRSACDAPRPIPFPGNPPPNGVAAAQIVAVVPVLGTELAATVEEEGVWRTYVKDLVAAQQAMPDRVGIFPLLVDPRATEGTVLGQVFQSYQRIAGRSRDADQEPEAELRCRDLAQGISQLAAGSDARLTIFISHTKRMGRHEEVAILIALVRSIIAETHLRQFFDANDLQPGRDWDAELRAQAATSALLALRTDLYASREWCQREMLIAKLHGMPIVILDCLKVGEERGSFLMDHVPRTPVRVHASPSKPEIRHGLNLLVDICLRRALWELQKLLAEQRPDLEVAWWAPHAPEPVTLAQWLEDKQRSGTRVLGTADLRIIHPDPPLGPEEKAVLQQIASLCGHTGLLDIVTPRTLAARGA